MQPAVFPRVYVAGSAGNGEEGKMPTARASNAPRSALRAACAGLVLLGALAATAVQAKEVISVRLEPTARNAGRNGSAMVYPVGDRTGVRLTVSGVPSHTSRPIHLYSALYEGSCKDGETGPTYPMRGRTLADSLVHPAGIGAYRGPLSLSHDLDVPFERLKGTPFAISVRLGPADGNDEILCGDSPG